MLTTRNILIHLLVRQIPQLNLGLTEAHIWLYMAMFPVTVAIEFLSEEVSVDVCPAPFLSFFLIFLFFLFFYFLCRKTMLYKILIIAEY